MSSYLIFPLFTSSSTVGLAIYQYPMFVTFLVSGRGTPDSIAGKPLSHFVHLFLKGGGAIHTFNSIAGTVGGYLAARWLAGLHTPEAAAMSRWYAYGAVFAAAHVVWFPLLAGPLTAIIAGRSTGKADDEVNARNRTEMRAWLFWHTVRTALADIPSFWCFAQGAALGLRGH